MTPAELRILVTVRSAEAKRALAGLKTVMAQIAAQVSLASTEMKGFNGVVASSVAPLRNSSKAAADLAAGLSLIGRSNAAANIKAINTASGAAQRSMGLLGKNTTTAATGMKAMNTASMNAVVGINRLSASSAKITTLGTTFKGAATGARSLNTALNGTSVSSARAVGGLNAATAAAERAGAAAAASATGFSSTAAGMAAMGAAGKSASAVTGATAVGAGAAAATQQTFAQSLKASSEEMRKQGSRAQWAGRQISMMFTAPIALAIGMGTKWNLDLQKQQTQLVKVYGDVNDPIDKTRATVEKLAKAFRIMSDHYGASQEEITGIGAAWAQAGKQGAALAEYTRLTVEAMIVGDITAEQAAQGMQAVSLQWGIAAKAAKDGALDMQGAMSLMNMASNITQVSFQDLFIGMEKVGGNARNLGFSFRETLALLTSITRVTGSAATAGNGLKSVMTRLLAPTQAAATQLENLGIQVNSQAWQNKAPMERLKEISQQVKGMDADSMARFNKEFAGLFQISRASQIFKDFADENGNINKVLKETADGAGETSKSFRQYQRELQLFLESNPQKMKIAGTMIKNSIMDVVIVLLPYIIATAKAIAGMARAFSEMDPTLQKIAIGFAVFLALVGPLAMLIASFKVLFGVLGGGLARMIGFFTVTKKGADGASTSLFRFGAAGRAAAKANKAAAAQVAGSTRVGFGAAVSAVVGGAKKVVTSAAAGARSAAASWRAGIMGVPASTAAAGAAAAAAQTRNNAVMLARISGGMAAIRAAQARGEQARISTIRLYGDLAAAEQAAGMRKQAAAVRTGGAAVVGAQAAVGRSQAAAAATGGVRAGASAAEGTKRGFKGRAGGIAGVFLNVLAFMPTSFFKAGFNAVKSFGKSFVPALKNFGGIAKRLMSKLGIDSVKSFGKSFARIGGGKGGLIGAAIAALVSSIAFAWDDIKKITSRIFGGDSNVPLLARPFVWAVEVIIAAVKKLPDVIMAVFRGIVQMITSAAKAVYNAFSYINPFAHHSPSLVENVTNGMAIVTSIFGDASKSIQADMRAAYGAIYKFGSQTANLNVRAANIKRGDDIDTLNKADPSGASAKSYIALEQHSKKLEANSIRLNAALQRQQGIVDALAAKVKVADKNIAAMQKTMDSLQKIADALSTALDAAKDKLDYYANAPIKGMRAMSDAIFENEMAQKKLQLQIMKLEDAGGSIDDITDKYARLQGQIETLSGQRADLQAKGAGSDILATYDKMIADLKAQQGAAISTGPAKEIEELNNSLDELKRKGEMLDLENSLKFDPLTRQIEQLVNTEQELDFSTIVAGVTTYKAQVEGLTVAHDFATAAVQSQQAAIDAATASRDAMNERLDAEQEKLDGIKSVYDQNQQAISDVQSAMDGLVSSGSTVVQKMEELKQKAEENSKSLKDAADKAGKLGDELDDISGFEMEPVDGTEFTGSLDDMIKEMEDKFGNMNPFSGMGDKIKNFFKELPGKIGGWLADAGKAIWDFVKKLPGELVKMQFYLIGFVAGLIAKIIVVLYNVGVAIGDWFVELPGKIWNWLSSIDWGQVASNIWNFIKGLFTGDTWSDIGSWLWDAGKWLIQGLWDGILSMVSGAWDWIKEHVVDPLINGFKEAMGIESPSTVFFEFGINIIQGLWNGIISLIGAVLEWFMGLPQKIFDAIGDLGGWVGRKFREAWEWVVENMPRWFENVANFFKNLPGNIFRAIGDLGGWIGRKFREAWSWIASKIDEWAKPVTDWFRNLPDLIGRMFNKVKDILKKPINFVIGTVYNNGLRRVWNNTAGKVGLPEMGEVQQLAKGGSVGNRIVGPGTGTSDSILTTAKAGSEIFTAREVANAGGFKGLESLLARMGVRSFMSSGRGGVPVALSNGEFRLDPSQVAQIGGSKKVKELRAQLAAGNIPGHDLGGIVSSVASLPGKAIKKGVDAARGGAGFAVEKALDALDKLIPDLLDPPGGEIGKLPQKTFDTFKQKIVDTIKGNSHAGGGTVRIPRFATGGTVPTTTTTTGATPATGGTETGGAAGTPSVDPATGAGLVESVTAATAAAEAVWQAYYTAIETQQVTNNTTMQSQQVAADAITLAQQATTIGVMQTASATFRASELAADLVYQTTLQTQDLNSKNVLNTQLTNFVSTQTAQWSQLRTAIVDTATGMNNDVSNQFNLLSDHIRTVVEDQITPTISSFEDLLNRTVGWFESASNDIGAMWSQTVPKVQDPTRTIINDVYNGGVRVAWSKVHTWLDLPELEQFVAPFAKGGSLGPDNMVSVSSLSNPNNPRSVKNGGPLKAASGSRDSTLFAGMRGEYVLNKKMVQGAGGIGNLEAWRKASLSGRGPIETGGTVDLSHVPGFAGGGALGMKTRPENQALPGVIQEVPKILKPYYGRVYDYGGGGQAGRGYDCSGWTGAVHQILTGGSHVGRIWTTEVNFGSYGYKRGNDGYWSMGVHNGGGGMLSHTAGTLAGVNYESGGAHNSSIWGGPAAGTINSQFENQYYLPSLGGKFIGTPGGGGGSVAITPMLLEMWDKEMDRVKSGISGLAYGGTIGKNPMAAYEKFNLLRGVVEKKGKEKDAAAAAAAAANYGQGPDGSYGGGVERWRSVVHDALARVGQPKSLDEITLRRMNQESGGNPRAINLYDSNAAAGTPSKGLMQVIDPTFQAYRDPSLSNNIWDPMANIVASMRYTLSRYGSLQAGYGRAGGYDSGGWLEPGLTAAVNATGKPEAILTNQDWKAVYMAAKKPALTVDDIAKGYAKGMELVFGLNTDKEVQNKVQAATEVALQGQNNKWNPVIVGAEEKTTDEVSKTKEAVYKVTDSVKGTGNIMTGILGATEDNKKVLDQMLAVMNAGAGTLGQIGAKWVEGENGKDGKWEYNVTFGAFAPLIESVAGLIESLPDADPTYVSWAGTNRQVTEEMAREKRMNDLANSSKGLYYAFKTIAPPLLKSTAKIGSAIEQLIQQDGEAWAMISAQIAAGNPTAYLAAAVLGIKAVLTMLPLIIEAIMSIGPAIIESLIAYFTKFEPDSVYAYGSYEAANDAVVKNQAAIRGGATGPNFETTTVQQEQQHYNFNFYGDVVVPNVTNDSGVDTLVGNLFGLAGI